MAFGRIIENGNGRGHFGIRLRLDGPLLRGEEQASHIHLSCMELEGGSEIVVGSCYVAEGVLSM